MQLQGKKIGWMAYTAMSLTKTILPGPLPDEAIERMYEKLLPYVPPWVSKEEAIRELRAFEALVDQDLATRDE